MCPESDRNLGLFDDLCGLPGVSVKYVTLRRGWYKWIRKAVYRFRYLTGLDIPMPSFLFDYRIDKLIVDPETVSLTVRSNVLEYVPMSYFEELRSRGIKCGLLLLDSMDAGSYTVSVTRKYIDPGLWDGIRTFDPVDAARYGFTFSGFHYYSKRDVKQSGSRDSDLYFVGSFKGERYRDIVSAFNVLTAKGVRCRFDILISKVSESGNTDQGLNTFTKSMPYGSVLDCVSSSGCILEILQKDQHGPSLRYFEAVVYNKKLVTNNHRITDYPYYDPEFMRIFDDVGDIDVEWIKSDITVEYHYKGDFSPVNMFLLKPTSIVSVHDSAPAGCQCA